MTTASSAQMPPQSARQRVLDVALALFTRHGYAGTSLQMIADEMGVTKGSLYYHFRAREDLLRALVGPLIEQLRAIVEHAEAQRSPSARAEHVLTGYARLAAANRALVAVTSGDPSVVEVIHADPDWADLISREIGLLAAVQPGLAGRVRATIVMAGIAATAAPGVVEADEAELCRQLIDAGRRALGLRAPRA
ncbi:TetR/AcrR family transcriptional regulator [Mycolicibacterium austroafricanum]|uniref:TetR/AcrR family transcriptional regulator n=1 Tax=Mycolicibacterium austroafricanum TaxID=39687 RepID=UPI001F4219D0|nr:TetR/AcrR family transcriptional regulator [Mycolicibacterium austroafricanum]